jgi:hypothetical protein
MIFIFGLTSKGATDRPLLDTHCYECKRSMTWDLFRDTEWMSAFFVRLLPIKSDYYLRCQGCHESLALSPDEVKGVKQLDSMAPEESKALHDKLVQRLETQQLSDKTETQREYLKSQRR